MTNRIALIWRNKELFRKIWLPFLLLAIYRFAAKIPIPGINTEAAKLALEMSGDVSEGLGSTILVLDVFTGGGISTFSVLTVGIYGHIIAQGIVQLVFSIIPGLERRLRDDPRGEQKTMDRWTSFTSILLTIPVSMFLLRLYGGGVTQCLTSFSETPQIEAGIKNTLGTITAILAIIAGAKFSEWVAQLISGSGFRGQGQSLIVAANILSVVPGGIAKLWQNPERRWINLGAFILITIVTVLGILTILQARRNIPVTYPGRRVSTRMSTPVKGTLPLFLNWGGPIPLIYAQGIISATTVFVYFLMCLAGPGEQLILAKVIDFFALNNFILWIMYFLLVVMFTYFLNDVYFHAQNYGENLKRSGARIIGVNPGAPTEGYLATIVRRITLPAAIFLGLLALLPFGVNWLVGAEVFFLSPVGLITVVVVIRDAMYTLDTEVKMLGYDDSLFVR